MQLELVEEQGRVTGRNWQDELRLPTYQEEWEAMAQVRGMSGRHVRFLCMDQSESRLPGHPRLNPKTVVLPEHGCPFELGHTGFVIGTVYAFITGFDDLRTEIPSLFGFALPFEPEGDFIIGQAVLFDSDLANASWEGLQKEILTHVCPMTWRADAEGAEHLVQVTLTPGDYPGCPNSQILAMWEAA